MTHSELEQPDQFDTDDSLNLSIGAFHVDQRYVDALRFSHRVRSAVSLAFSRIETGLGDLPSRWRRTAPAVGHVSLVPPSELAQMQASPDELS